MRLVLLSNHAWGTPNKAGFHLLAEAFWKLGHTVTFITTGLSFFSVMRRDRRLKTGRPLKRLHEEAPGLYTYLHFTPLHPHTLVFKPLDALTSPLVRRYGMYSLGEAESHIRQADIIFYESCSAICLLERLKNLAPSAIHVYRASDLLLVMRSLHPEVRRMEKRIIPEFDMVSVPTPTMAKHFSGNSHVFIHEHGVDTELFNRPCESPFEPSTRNAVFIGNSQLDCSFLDAVPPAFPDVQFHLIGSVSPNTKHANVHCHGLMDFCDTIKFLKFATVGLYCMRNPNPAVMDSYGRTLKMKQYMYCMLPVVLPVECNNMESDEFFQYDFHDVESMVSAMAKALNSPHKAEWQASCRDWKQVAISILEDALKCARGKSSK